MKDMALTDEFVVHFAFPEQNIRAGVPVKGEGAVSAGVQLDKGQGGVDFFGGHQSPGINTVALHNGAEKRAETVLPHFADEGGPASQ